MDSPQSDPSLDDSDPEDALMTIATDDQGFAKRPGMRGDDSEDGSDDDDDQEDSDEERRKTRFRNRRSAVARDLGLEDDDDEDEDEDDEEEEEDGSDAENEEDDGEDDEEEEEEDVLMSVVDGNEAALSSQQGGSAIKTDADPEQVEKARLEALGNMEKIQKEFTDLKEKFFREQFESLKEELDLLHQGSHQEYLDSVEELNKQFKSKLWRAEQWRQYQIDNVEATYQAEKQQADDDLNVDKQAYKQKLVSAIEKKMQKLDEEKNTMSLGESRPTRQLRKRGKETENKEYVRRRLNPPHINYTLRDAEIYEDLDLIVKNRPSDSNFDLNRWLSYAPTIGI
eukprot:TRINITY_DN4963_c0_g1_i1.p1 TRINITY_DN4963_c0_g1~~TRINITY_DN4963_c0_g1_i1.p1  ORF type:complete len:348 (-),score=183.96 TRINITY_DN4963_c0_g1_i1:55-1074(-)